jgi:HEPN domain-containing protein
MAKDYKEWFKQSDYDYETALFMYESGRYFYSVFMCHLSIEKSLKGLYLKRIKLVPPKIHTLSYFVGKLNLNLPKDLIDFIDNMDDAGVAPVTLRP